MSSFIIMAIRKSDRTEHTVWCLDDYFGKHKYGYIIHGKNEAVGEEDAMTEDDFYKQYESKVYRLDYE